MLVKKRIEIYAVSIMLMNYFTNITALTYWARTGFVAGKLTWVNSSFMRSISILCQSFGFKVNVNKFNGNHRKTMSRWHWPWSSRSWKTSKSSVLFRRTENYYSRTFVLCSFIPVFEFVRKIDGFLWTWPRYGQVTCRKFLVFYSNHWILTCNLWQAVNHEPMNDS